MTRDLAQEAFTVGRLAWMWQEGSLKPPPYEKSSADCLDDDFFYEYLNHLDDHIFEEYPEKEAYELAEATAKSRQKLFKDARDWPLPYLVASAVYKMLSTEGKQIHMISHLWRELLWPFLSFDEPFCPLMNLLVIWSKRKAGENLQERASRGVQMATQVRDTWSHRPSIIVGQWQRQTMAYAWGFCLTHLCWGCA